jgi:hypothetical protein
MDGETLFFPYKPGYKHRFAHTFTEAASSFIDYISTQSITYKTLAVRRVSWR